MSDSNNKLKDLLVAVFNMMDEEYIDSNGPDEIEGWDSLATVSMAVGVNEEFGHHMTPDEVGEISNIGDIKAFLIRSGVDI